MKRIANSLPAQFIAFLLIICLSSCGNNKKESISNVKWLIGTWQHSDDFGNISYETWKEVSSNELSGKSYVISENDTAVFETLNIKYDKGTLCYFVQVLDHNDNQTIKFSSKFIDAGKMEFENPQHNFPKIITYQKISNDSLVAVISGALDGAPCEFDLRMSRVKN